MRGNVYFYFMHTHIFFILSLVFLWFYTTTAASFGHQQLLAAAERGAKTCINKEKQALLDIKAHLHDPHDRLSTWRPEEEADCCQWEGVTCNYQTGHVIGLYLSGLEGEITFSLLNLTYLNELHLWRNSFHGTIPKFICSMTHLTSLDLFGTIPDCIGNMTQLTELSLGGLTGVIPKFICSMTHLTSLYLGDNQLTGTTPECIGYMTNLTLLHLSDISIPRSIGSLTKLTWLSLSDISFYGTIPTEFENLTNLEDLFLSGLTVENIDNWVNVFIGLQNLYELSLDGCDLSQVMHPVSPSVTNSSSSLVYLNLYNNNLTSSVFRWLCPLFGNKLTDLSLSRNKFDGKLSDFLNNLSGCTSAAATLQELHASSNQLIGSLSDDIQHFSSLQTLDLSSNQLDGTITDKLWQLPSLRRLYLSSNSLRGAISENIGKSNQLYIDLSNNSLEGVFFNDDVSKLSWSIEYINFSSNNLGPRFPEWIQKLKNLTHLDLSKNNISDTVSIEYWNQWKSSHLIFLDLSVNKIIGKLPKSLSKHDLEIIDLSFNCFFGQVPALPANISFLDLSRNKFHRGITSLCQIYKNLEFIDLSYNKITGQLPDCLQNLTYLKVLNLGHNSLSGRIPLSVGCLGHLETLSLYGNKLSGALPMSLKNCTRLGLLDLGDNSLYGDIPVWIGNKLSRLYALSLKSNNFFGTIPSQICQLVSLQILDLSYNKLYGTIPPCVSSLTSMVKKGLLLEQNVHPYVIVYDLNTANFFGGGSFQSSYIDHLMIEWQGKVNEFRSILGLLNVIDLSSNNLTGQIPNEVSYLHGLLVLDLSDNSLDGNIPRDIDQMTQLLTLNLSRNMLSGEIPPTMTEMSLLNNLDLSFNDLSGRIPLATQLQTFNASTYIENAGLCGLPLPKKCSGDEDLGVPHVGENDGDGESSNELQRWFYIGGASGFATGFWIVCSALLLNRRGRHAFFQFHDSLKDWVYVNTLVFIAKLQRVARA